jgi:hypothetical protein
MAGRRIIYVQPPLPLGEVTVVPAALSGRAEAETVRAMAAAAAAHEAPTAADVLRRLRRVAWLTRSSGFASGAAAARGRGIG